MHNMAHGPGTGASLADVAKLAKVSTQTASRVANGSDAVRPDTRERVLAAMAELSYRPSFAARSLRAGSYHSIGLSMSGNMEATGRRFQVEGLTAAATRRRYAITLLQLDDDEATLSEASRRMASLPVDGQILYLGATPPDFATFEPPQALPTVIISTQHHPYCATISNDQTGCSVSIVNHFVQKGHREIRFVGGRRESFANVSRQKGWEQALRMRGLHVVEPMHGDWTADSGYEIGMQLVNDKSCTAIYASNDAIAVGIIYALRDAGLRVPQDISVIGVDDSLVGVIPHLELSSYRFNDTQVGALAFDLATNPPEGKKPPHILVPGTLVERSTVAQAPR